MTRSVHIVERMRWMSALVGAAVLALAVGLALAIVSGHVPAPAAGNSTALTGSAGALDPRIAVLAERDPGSNVQAIVQFNAPVSPAQAQVDAARAHARVIGKLPIIHGLALALTAGQARTLAGNPDVHSVSLNARVTTQSLPSWIHFPWMPRSQSVSSDQLQTTYDQTLGVTSLWKFGITGTGVGVAVIDTGVDGALPDFAGSGGHSRVIVSAVDNTNAQSATDGYGHGTDVAGIIAGNGDNRPASDPLHGEYLGVAPDANLISLKVSDESGNTTVLDVIYALQFAVEHQAQYNIRVVNLSLDSATPQSYKTDPLDAAVESAWMHGIVVVVAAGNRGTASDAVQYSPANDPYVITVGGVDENGSADPSQDTIAPWSSQGTTQDGIQKPDVYAPGAHIVSVLAPGSVFATSNCNCLVGNGQYIQTSGTSMAAPAISGLVADLLQLHPRWTPDQVKGVLTSPAVSDNPTVHEPNAVKAALDWNPILADQGLTPSGLIDVATGNARYALSTWSLSTWSRATGLLHAGYAGHSYSCASCSAQSAGSVNSSLSTWNLSSWSVAAWG
jgi:serine protease AprX